jgi:segregation and condensation protein B
LTHQLPQKDEAVVKIDHPDEIAFDVNSLPGGLKGALEAILITCTDPQSVKKLAYLLSVSEKEVQETLEKLKIEYLEQQRGFILSEVGGMWRFYSAPEYGEIISQYIVGNSESKLSIAALETLAIIAYRQPISRSEVASVRGVNVDGVSRTLLQRGLIAEAKEKTDNGAVNYVTTPLFLEKLGISSLEQLEPLAPFLPSDISDIPEFEDIRKPVRKSAEDEELAELESDIQE